MKVISTTIGKYKNIIFDSENPEGRIKIRNIRRNNPKSLIVFATGCFDVAQPGHPLFAEQVRSVGDNVNKISGNKNGEVIVVIGVGRDSTLSALKKGRPIVPENNRTYLVASYKDVDYVILDNIKISEGKIDFEKTLQVLQPDIFVLNDDDSGKVHKKKLCKSLGIIFKTVKRETPEFISDTSSTEIIEYIKGLEK